jgi:RNA polymerase sigma-70 factor (ECF subfamily)
MGAANREMYAQLSIMTPGAEFTQLYEQHYAMVYRTALRITGNPADAEDVLQTVFLRVLNQGDRQSSPELRPAYFHRASANAAVDLLRRRVSRAESQLDDAAPAAAVESQPLLKERLRRAIASLEHDDAVLFLLRYVEGLSNGELAEIFELERSNIAVRLHRIRQALQVEMER